MRALLLVAALALGGCGVERNVGFTPTSDATHVTGILKAKDDQRPVDGPITLTVEVGPGKEERVVVPSLFTAEPPSTEKLALQQKADELKVGDRLTATGTRDGDGVLVAERIEIHLP